MLRIPSILVLLLSQLLLPLFANAEEPTSADVVAIALSGTSAPGDRWAGRYEWFTSPSINSQGNVAFYAITRNDLLASSGIWLGNSESLQPLVQAGDSLADDHEFGEIGFHFIHLLRLPLNDADQVAFGTRSGDQKGGILIASPEGIEAVVRFDTLVNHTTGEETYLTGFVGHQLPTRWPGAIALNNFGQLSFTSTYGPTVGLPTQFGFWIQDAATSELTLLGTDGMPSRRTLGGGRSPAKRPEFLNDQGTTAFITLLDENNERSGALAVGDVNSLSLTVEPGTAFPNGGKDFFISPLGNPYGVNLHNQVLFPAWVGRHDYDRGSLVVSHEGQLELVARSRDPLPRVLDDHHYGNIVENPGVISDLGTIALVGSITDHLQRNPRGAVFAGPPDDLLPIAVQGEPAPGTDGVFVQFDTIAPAMNAFGQLAFQAGLDSGNGTESGLWATDRHGQLTLILQEGDLLQIHPGDVREVASIGFTAGSGGSDGRGVGLNDRGQIAFAASFVDGSQGVFVSNRVAVPEPSSFVAAIIAITTLYGSVRLTREPPLSPRRS